MMPVIVLLLIVTANFPVDIHVPAMPIIAKQLHMSVSMTQMTLSLFLLGYGAFPLLFGTLSDAFGRKKVCLSALLLLMAGCLMSVCTMTPWVLLLSRFIQGVGASACIAIPRAIMRDCYEGKAMAKMASLVAIGVELSLAFSPVIGGFLVHHFGWHSNFMFILLLSLLAFVVVAWLYRETNGHLQPELLRPRVLIKQVASVLSHQQFIRYVVCSATAFGAAMAFFAVSPFIIQDELHYSAYAYGWISLLLTGAIVLGSVVNAVLINRMGIDRMVRFGLLALLSSGVLLLFVSRFCPLTLFNFIAPASVGFFGLAFLFGNCMSGGLLHFPKSAGITGSLYSTIQTSSTFLVTSIIALLPHGGATLVAVLILLMAGGSLLNFLRTRPN